MEFYAEMSIRRYLWRSVAQNPAWSGMIVKICFVWLSWKPPVMH